MNSTLGSVVPLAMFFYLKGRRRSSTREPSVKGRRLSSVVIEVKKTALILKACKNANKIFFKGPPQFISCLFEVALSFPSFSVIWLLESKFNEYHGATTCISGMNIIKKQKNINTDRLCVICLFFCVCLFLGSVCAMQELSD